MELMVTDKKFLITASALAAILAWTACSNAPKPTTETKTVAEAKKEPPRPPEPVAAQTAFYEMYKPARAWAADLMPLSLASNETAIMKNEGGKAAIWTAVFVSPQRREARTFFYSAVDDGESIRRGVTAGGAQRRLRRQRRYGGFRVQRRGAHSGRCAHRDLDGGQAAQQDPAGGS